MDLQLNGRNVVVTGGSRGIGRAVAERFVAEGANVALCARGEDGVKAAVSDLTGRGTKVIGASVNMADPEQLQDWVRASAAELGGLDVYVHNASTGPLPGEKGWKKGLDVDLLGLVRVLEVAQPFLTASGQGAIVAIGSTSALENFAPEPSSHYAFKAALIHYCGQLARQLAPQGIRVNAVSPGPVFIEGGSWDKIKQFAEPIYHQTVAEIPIGRMGEADEIARTVAFLASPAASFVTGANLVVDGGFTRRINF